MPQTQTFDKRAAEVKKSIISNDGKSFSKDKTTVKDSGILGYKAIQSNILLDMKSAVRQVDALRRGSKDDRPVDLSTGEYMKEKFGFGTLDSFYSAIGVNPSSHTVEQLQSMPDFDEGFRWLIPEVIREAVRLGLRRNPIYPDLVAAEESVTQKKVTLPHVNMSDATPEVIGETETIPVGIVSFGEKDVKLQKIGTGLKVSDEVQKYVSLNILSLYLQDAGIKLGLGLDTMAIDVLLNGESDGGEYAAPVIGVENVGNGVTYFDILRAWLRMGRLGRTPTGMVSSEEEALKILLLEEFLKSGNGSAPRHTLNIKTPIPQSQDYLIHGAMPTGDKLGIIDNTSSLLKMNASALTVESERIAERQMSGTYVTITTGFAKLFTDGFIVIDGSLDFAVQGFPSYMDVNAAENVIIK